MSAADPYPSYRAPQTNGEVLCVPSWDSLRESVPTARATIESSNVAIMGLAICELATRARSELVAAARNYVHSYLPSLPALNVAGPLILTGHQPELVHPGVWLKNFAAAKLAKSLGGTAISLIIDNDLCRQTTIRVPTGTVEQPQVVDIAFDAAQPAMPYEERQIHDSTTWKSFAARASTSLAPLVPNAMLANWWPTSPTSRYVGTALAQARHQWESARGSHSLEVPQSTVCQSNSFRMFALHLLFNATEVCSAYGDALADYRSAHRVRSPAQPMPDLRQVDDWVETPFWVWSQGEPARRALFVRQTRTGLSLTDRHDWQATLPLTGESDAGLCIETLTDWERSGIKIRTRALMTTLYARLLLADAFIHGIGGAKYDQVTDQLCKRLFGISLPPFVVLSGTLRLPIEHTAVPTTTLASLKKRLRELRFHPETHINPADHLPPEQDKIRELIALKEHWVQTPKISANAAERHQQITYANEHLQTWLESRRQQTEREIASVSNRTRANQLLESREYPFCLFPPKVLEAFLLDF